MEGSHRQGHQLETGVFHHIIDLAFHVYVSVVVYLFVCIPFRIEYCVTLYNERTRLGKEIVTQNWAFVDKNMG